MELGGVYLGVDLGACDRGVPQHLLEVANVCPRLQGEGGKGMAQAVNGGLYSCGPGVLLEGLDGRAVGEPMAFPGNEQCRRIHLWPNLYPEALAISNIPLFTALQQKERADHNPTSCEIQVKIA